MYQEHISNSLEAIKGLPTQAELDDIIEMFVKAERVVFCTMGKSAFACRKIVYTARSYGLQWHDLDVCHAFHGDAGIIKKNDLLVMVSKSGETRETVEVAKYFSDWNTIAVTSQDNCSLSQICDDGIIIPILSESSPFGYAPMISTSMYMIVLHGILSEVIVNKDIRIQEYARNHPAGKIGKDLKNAGL
jgi:arabinose-5-phosphate isomerase